MNTSTSFRNTLLAGAAFLISVTAHAACDFPANVQIPDGSTATEAELVAAQSAVKQYMANVEAYLVCIDEEAEALGPEITEDQIRIRDMRHNAAVDEMERLAADFNAQIRAFRANQ